MSTRPKKHAAIHSARSAGLCYVNDARPGLRREKAGDSFRYRTAEGAIIRNRRVLQRVDSLGIPPAWEEVWICTLPHGHVQATGRDERGRKQHLYHPRWREVRDQDKFDGLTEFARALPGIRRRLERDLARRRLCREKVLATVVRLLEVSLIRVGNAEYARENKSYGLTTLRDRHTRIRGGLIEFQFRGKSGKDHTVQVEDRRLAKIVRDCQDLPGQELFQYLDADGTKRDVSSEDVNDYLREISGREFTAKIFRTWMATVWATAELTRLGPFQSATQAKRHVNAAVKATARNLGNTPTVCRNSYIHPAIIQAYLEGTLLPRLQAWHGKANPASRSHLRVHEGAVLKFLEQQARGGKRAR